MNLEVHRDALIQARWGKLSKTDRPGSPPRVDQKSAEQLRWFPPGPRRLSVLAESRSGFREASHQIKAPGPHF